jgi:hypothetical protein
MPKNKMDRKYIYIISQNIKTLVVRQEGASVSLLLTLRPRLICEMTIPLKNEYSFLRIEGGGMEWLFIIFS